jgi:thioredoxin reductase (NADPH)
METDAIIVGGGPCGLAAAIALQEKGLHPIVIEKGNIVDAIYRYPTHQQFFSTSEKLEIGNVPFIIEERKPRRNQALSYYREVVRRKNVTVNSYERVDKINKQSNGRFTVEATNKAGKLKKYETSYIVIATGYYDSPNLMNIPGEESGKVFHYFKEAHPFFDCDVVVTGGKNSAVDATLELQKAGARVTVLYRGDEYSDSIKPWILPEYSALVKKGLVKMEFNAVLTEIHADSVVYKVNTGMKKIKNDFVFAMTGYHPNHSFIASMGVQIDHDTGRPAFNPETMETNVEGIFIAGVIAAGNNANEIFIENGRFHGPLLAEEIANRKLI